MISAVINKSDLSTIRRIILGLGVRVAGAVAALVFGVIVGRTLGVENAGLFFLALAIVSVAATISVLGQDTASVKIVGREWGESHLSPIQGIYVVTNAMTLAVGTAFGATLWFFAGDIATAVFSKPELRHSLQLLAIVVPALALVQIHAAFFRGARRVGTSFFLQAFLIPAVATALVIFSPEVLSLPEVTEKYRVAVLATLATAIVLWLFVAGASRPGRAEELVRELARIAPPMLQSAFLNVVVTRWLALILLGFWGSNRDVGEFGASARIAVAISLILVAANAVAAPQMAKSFAAKQTREMAKTGATAAGVAIVFASPLLMACLIAPAWILGWFGEDFVSAAGVLVVLTVGEMVNLAAGPVGAMLQMSRHEKVYRNCTLAGAAILILSCVALIPRTGALGAAAATSLSLAATNLFALISTYRLLGVVPIPWLATRLARERSL